MKKLEGYRAEVIKGMINEGETLFEIDGKRYAISAFSEKDIRDTTVKEDVENDIQLMDILKRAKRDIQDGHFYTTDEMRELIRRGEV